MLRFAVLFSCTCLTAQEPAREAVAGRVLDGDGKPVSGAEVVLLHRPVPASLDVGPEDRVRAATDARGIFRAALLRDTIYSAWAAWVEAATGFAEGVRAGDFVVLEEEPGSGPRRVRIEGKDAWKQRGPLSYRALVGSEHIDFVNVEENEGVLAIPSLPPLEYRAVEVFDRDGVLLWAEGLPVDDSHALPLPGPVSFDLLVQDADSGAPVSGAEIRHHIRNYWYTSSPAVWFGDRFCCLWPSVATTDARGRARVQVAAKDPVVEGKPRSLHLMASRDGYRAAVSGRVYGKPYRNGLEVEGAGDVIEFHLVPSEPVTGQVPLDSGPIESGWLVPTWLIYVKDGQGGAIGLRFDPPPLGIRDGCFSYSPLPEGSRLEHAWTLLPTAVRESLAERFGCTLPTGYLLPHPEAPLVSGGIDQLDPDRMRAIETVSPHGQPTARAIVLVSPILQKGLPSPHLGTLLRTDRRGRALLTLRRARQHFVVLSEGGWAAGALTESDPDLRQLQLQPLRYASGRVVDEAGEPVGRALVEVLPTAVGDPGAVHEAEARHLWSLRGAVRADDEGRFRVPYLPLSFDWSLEARMPGRGDAASNEVVFFGADEEEPEQLTLVVKERK